MTLADLARDLSLTLIPFILSLSVHEFAHAWMAHRLGDPTARELGRLTLSPAAHVDVWGTILIPVLGVFSHFPYIAWAKPVPFRSERFRPGVNRRLGAAMVAAAGPLSNLLLAAISIAIMAVLLHANVSLYRPLAEGAETQEPTPVAMLLSSMFERNIALAVFNLLPFPPLDGHYLLPPAFDPIVRPMARYGFAILMVACLVSPGFLPSVMGPPMHWLASGLARLFGVA
jgi:Zn-dependent protease